MFNNQLLRNGFQSNVFFLKISREGVPSVELNSTFSAVDLVDLFFGWEDKVFVKQNDLILSAVIVEDDKFLRSSFISELIVLKTFKEQFCHNCMCFIFILEDLEAGVSLGEG